MGRRILAQFASTDRAGEVAVLLGGGKRVVNSGVILAPPAALLRHVDAIEVPATYGGSAPSLAIGRTIVPPELMPPS